MQAASLREAAERRAEIAREVARMEEEKAIWQEKRSGLARERDELADVRRQLDMERESMRAETVRLTEIALQAGSCVPVLSLRLLETDDSPHVLPSLVLAVECRVDFDRQK